MAALLIYIVLLGGFFLLNKKKFGFNGGTFLIGIYLLGAVLGVYMVLFTNFYEEERLNSAAALYHSICLFLFLYPIVYVSNKHLVHFQVPNERGLKIVYYIIIGMSVFSFISFAPKIGNVLAVGDFKDARNMYNYGQLYEQESGGGILGYLGGIGSSLAFFSLYFCFYNLKNHPEKKKLIISLLICSLTDVVLGLSMVGRGGIIRWLFMLLFFYFTFSQYLQPKLKHLIRRTVLFFSLPLMTVLIAITLSRFTGREYPVFVYMFDYIGQSFIYFSYIFDQFFESTFGGRLSFPILFPDDRIERVLSEVVYADYSLNTFSTFIGTFYKDMGFIGTLGLSIGFYVVLMLIYRFNTTPRTFSKLFVYIVVSQMIINGVFYFQYTGTTKIRSFILMILIAYVIQFLFKKNNRKPLYQ